MTVRVVRRRDYDWLKHTQSPEVKGKKNSKTRIVSEKYDVELLLGTGVIV